MADEIKKRMKYALEIIRTFKSKPRANASSSQLPVND